jgi:hypothetical protein
LAVAGGDGARLEPIVPQRVKAMPGRKPSPQAQEVNKFCYQEFVAGKKLSIIVRDATDRFGRTRAPKSQSHAYEKAKRYAKTIGETLPHRAQAVNRN